MSDSEMSESLIAFLARWALLHELADEAWKEAVARGRSVRDAGMTGGPDSFLDGLAAVVAEEKDSLRERLLARDGIGPSERPDVVALLEEVRFELGEVRGRLESLETSLDALARRVEVAWSGGRDG